MKRCDKTGYESEGQAKWACAHASFRVRPYLCPRCRLWHVTNSDKTGHERPHPSPSRRRREKQKSLKRPAVTDPTIAAELFGRGKRPPTSEKEPT